MEIFLVNAPQIPPPKLCEERVATFCRYLFETPRRALYHRKRTGVMWGAWLLDLRQDRPGEDEKRLRLSSVDLFQAQTVAWASLVAFPDQLAFSGLGSDDVLRKMVRKCDQTGDTDEQRLADDHRSCFADPLSQSWRRSNDQGPHAIPGLPRWCRARRGVRTNKTPHPIHVSRRFFGFNWLNSKRQWEFRRPRF